MWARRKRRVELSRSTRALRNTWVISAAVLSVIVGTCISDAFGETIWRWTDSVGAAFTDNENRIPEMFKDQAIRLDFEKMLEKRTQMIITEKEQMERLQKRLDHLKGV